MVGTVRDPKIIKLELTERCNAHCVFCTNATKKHGPDMDFDTACAIIDAFPDAVEVQPQFFGEPLLYPRIVDLVRYAKSRGKRVVFYTNGALLEGDLARDMADAAPDRIIFSVDTSDADTYAALRPPLTLARVVANIEAFQAIKSPETRTCVRATLTAETRPQKAATKAFFASRVDQVAFAPEVPKAREVAGSFKRGAVCKRMTDQVVVKHDGSVVLCCIDWEAEAVMGHVNDGVQQVWSGVAFTHAREHGHALCDRCGFTFVPDPR